MKILLLSSEVIPFAKTGGLADVCGALPIELERMGHEVVVAMPGYRTALNAGIPFESRDLQLTLPMGDWEATGTLVQSTLPDSSVPLWMVRSDGLFDRDGLYQDHHGDYGDNLKRFAFFCRFVLDALKSLNWFPDIVHCNDWQTGVVPALLATRYAEQPGYRDMASLMTIHNLAYQGVFAADQLPATGMDPSHFNWREMEFFGHINLLKTGIVFADAVSTVSPHYAREIQTAEHGCGLENVLRGRNDRLFGLLNGIDSVSWDPATDTDLAARYSVENWRDGKRSNKQALQQEAGLADRPDVPMIGLVGRLVAQKGWSLILPVMEQWLGSHEVQWVVLGTGDPGIEDALRGLRQRFPDRLVANLGFSEPLARRIEAASDIFLMPSRYEPCGLNQMYSMRYGAVPVVHRTGGLADTVVDANPDHLARRTANGFSFDHFDETGLHWALARAVNTLTHQPDVWDRIVRAGMMADWSWSRSAARYADLYQWLIAERTGQSRYNHQNP